MIAEIGHFALALACAAAIAQSLLPLAGAQLGNARWMEFGRSAALVQLAGIAIAFACLMWLYAVSDFSVKIVAANSHSLKPMLYKLTGVWGNHEGSLVLWALILALYGAAVAVFGQRLPTGLRARVLGIQGMIGAAFLLFSLLTSNPFERIFPAPFEGNGLNPILQDPGLAFHPPFLYLGYVGFSMAFAFAVAGLIEGRIDAGWARWVRPWTLGAWAALTLGIALGSWWAYYELGWGGFWFWDPVENASFMPWLAGTALLHSAIVVEKREALKSWTVLLAILTFGLALVGTFLVRSGVLVSVHAFAVDPERGLFILAILLLSIGGALALYAWRAPQLSGGGLFAPLSREGGMVFNNLILVTATATVFIGTLYPLFLDALGGDTVSVGPPFYNLTFVPLVVPLLLAVALGPLLPWKRADLGAALARLKLAALIALCAAALALWFAGLAAPGAVFGIAVAGWLIGGALGELADRLKLFRIPPGESWNRARHLPGAAWGMSLAHGGLGIVVAGIVATSAWQAETVTALKPGESAEIGRYEVTLERVAEVPGPNYTAIRAEMSARAGDGRAIALYPERRFFPERNMWTTEAAIRTSLLADLYAVIGERQEDGAWVVRLYHNPLVPWIWLGAVVMVMGGLCSLADRRLRIGAPKRARDAVPEAAT